MSFQLNDELGVGVNFMIPRKVKDSESQTTSSDSKYPPLQCQVNPNFGPIKRGLGCAKGGSCIHLPS